MAYAASGCTGGGERDFSAESASGDGAFECAGKGSKRPVEDADADG